MSLSRFDTFARSVVGPSAAGAQVFLCLQPVVTTSLPPSPLAQLYSDPLGANPISQPLVCDGFGHASCYVASGTFTEVVVYGGMLVQVYPDQFIASTIAVQVNGLEVNGNPVTGPNFNSTVPATPVVPRGRQPVGGGRLWEQPPGVDQPRGRHFHQCLSLCVERHAVVWQCQRSGHQLQRSVCGHQFALWRGVG